MGIHPKTKIEIMNSHIITSELAENIKVGDNIFTNMNLSRVYYVDYTDEKKLLIKLHIYNSLDEKNQLLGITADHTMTVFNINGLPENIRASDIKKDDKLLHWGNGEYIVKNIELIAASHVNIFTDSGMLMSEKVIFPCFPEPYDIVRYGTKPLKLLSNIHPLLANNNLYKPFKRIYKHF